MRWLYRFALSVMLFSLMAADAYAEKRVALVIGNGAYRNVPTLPNPPNDATDVAAALRRSGFDVIVETNLDQIGMQDASIRFAREARTADVALFYYSGHALQFAGVNYLVPVDASLRDEADLRRMARADQILADLQQAKNLRILVLDACREHIEDKDNVTTVFQHVSASVYEDTRGSQVPELSLSFFGEFYLNGKLENSAAPTSPASPVDPCAAAADHWRSAEAVGTVNAFDDHMLRFPTCAFAGLAKSRIAALSKPGAAVSPSNPFDGIWIVREICERKPGWQAGTYQFAGRIKDRIFHYQYGTEGKPGSATYDGKIEPDGTSEISVKGLTGDAAYDPLHRVPGTEFHFKMVIKLEGSRGAGVRSDSPRPCRSEWSMLSSTAASTPNANTDSPEKSTVDGDSNPGSEKPKLRAAIAPDRREPEASRNRQVTGGLSCTKMLGRCGAVCAANTGRPDCASTVCVRLQQQCLNTGCWNGRAFSGCGLIKQ